MVKGGFDDMEERFCKIDEKFFKIDEKFCKVDERFDNLETKVDSIDRRLKKVETGQEELKEIVSGVYRIEIRELKSRVEILEKKAGIA
jgi:predicted nuclease with TOPRIM domain